MRIIAIAGAALMVLLASMPVRADVFDPFDRALFRPAERSHALISMRFVADEQELKRECAHIGVFNVSAAIGYCHHWTPRELTDSCRVIAIAGYNTLVNVIWGMVRCTSQSIESRIPEGRERDLAMLKAQSILQIEPLHDQRLEFQSSLFKHGLVVLRPIELPEILATCREQWPDTDWPEGLAVCTTWKRKDGKETCNIAMINKTFGETSPLSVVERAMRGCNKVRDP